MRCPLLVTVAVLLSVTLVACRDSASPAPSADMAADGRKVTRGTAGLANPGTLQTLPAEFVDVDLASSPQLAKRLLLEVQHGRLDADLLDEQVVRQLLATGDPEIHRLVETVWGSIRTEVHPLREQVVAETLSQLSQTSGDPLRGEFQFHQACGVCHRLFGKGQEVGPDLTRSVKSSLEQLVSGVFDPNRVIRAEYRAYTLITNDGRVLSGVLINESPQRVVLNLQGGRQESFVREEIDVLEPKRMSLMPEGFERQFTPQQIADLFAYMRQANASVRDP